MGIIKRSIRNKKFSREVADHVSKARRASTRQVYNSRWQIFASWADKRKINPSKATPDIIADFLIYLFKDKNCQVSTIKGYRSMISNTLKFSSYFDIGNDPVLSELIKSFQTQRPVNRPLAPKWDLAFVLTFLCKEPYEPLNAASLIHLSMKTAFLLTMATARRVSEVHAFAMDKEHLRFSSVDGSLTVRTQVGFLAKNQLPSKAPDSIHIPRLSNSSRNNVFNRLLCPVRAVKLYLKRTKSIRGTRTRLFIPTKGNHDINKSTISSWVKFTIKKAYKSISNRNMPLLKPRAHELRALSASWAYFNFIPLDEVIKAAVWSSSSTFAKFYLRDFSVQQANLKDLGSLVVAQKVVGGTEVPVPAREEL
ncbi:MAG: site-specific integrase [Candidatus Thiodiazotropha taylori]|nr:site-specific integrase [Candidatus Thiodiazotropha taylori]MCW4263402.1 site-specific integrase [Candidatus Thiodiazotropha endolucinida]MCG8044854.1 site-specific integrase [Candidatus Thiodiazotropha taylori]MCG8077419.1 site-specific integrase [Candidatus Thiodiazotropha taylori]MCG8116729.1 site-specific integrase [Candidatus Thiodiazotropha taylori]